jgi:electron-transferring-flavoprotein dehydrogenase
MDIAAEQQEAQVERQSVEVDIACVGFGPAMGGFLTTLSRALAETREDGTPALESKAMPGMPAQVICYERADDIGFGVSGVVTKARGIRVSLPELDPSQIPMAAAVKSEKVLYLLDPVGASRRPAALKIADKVIRSLGISDHDAIELPYTPDFLHKKGGLVLSIGQFNQWVGAQLMGAGQVQIWPSMPVSKPLIENDSVVGVRLIDQGVDKSGNPDVGFMPGMDIRAALTVVGDGPVGAVGREIDEHFGMPEGHHKHEWAVGMKFVIDLPESCTLEPGTVLHTIGYPEPEIFGFMYVHPERVASVGIFVPSWFTNPVRTGYRYLQHYIMHPYLWQYLEGGTLRSWGAKSLNESGKQGEPHLAGNGYARIGEGSGSTNVLTGSGVDEAWTTGVQLADGVIELVKAGKPFTKENLESAYVAKRRASWVEKEGLVAEHSRDGFQKGFLTGLIGMGICGLTKGKVVAPGRPLPPQKNVADPVNYYRGKLEQAEVERIKHECAKKGTSLHDVLMDRMGWPQIPFDGKLLVTHQDALLMGGKVQAAGGFADHVMFVDSKLCEECGARVCYEICSAQAIQAGERGLPVFDREKCVFCGACMWNCSQELKDGSGRTNIVFKAGAGGLHSAEN